MGYTNIELFARAGGLALEMAMKRKYRKQLRDI